MAFADYKESLCISHPLHAHNVFYTLPTRTFSTSHHTFVGHCPCALIFALNPRIVHVNQFVYSLYPRSIPPRIRDLNLPFNNEVMIRGFPLDGATPGATRGLPPLCFYHRANYLTLNRIRDDPEIPTLTSLRYSDTVGMTVMHCINFCIDHGGHTFAGLENGSDCCECTSRRCLQVIL